MLKTLVLVGFVASALAEPVLEAAAGTSRLGLYDVYATCQKYCSPYANSPTESKKCIVTCIYYEQGSRKMEEQPIFSVRQARDLYQCNKDCSRLTLNPYTPIIRYIACLEKCKSQGKSLEDTLANAQKGTLTQITDILSQVIKRQQEMLQMINSCNCANKPVVP